MFKKGVACALLAVGLFQASAQDVVEPEVVMPASVEATQVAEEVAEPILADVEAPIQAEEPEPAAVAGEGEEACTNVDGFVDADGDGCEVYEKEVGWCATASTFKNADGLDASTACCACANIAQLADIQVLQTAEGDETLLVDAGNATVVEAPTFAEVFDPTGDRSYGVEGCTTDPEWKDSEGDDCAAYEQQRHYCATAEQYPGPNNVTATEACCVCPAYNQILADLQEQQPEESAEAEEETEEAPVEEAAPADEE
uniref:Uncharacterized protein n=1 Tax=Chromera velia CCMP2878 TaxID=1169474 RepID=A0A0G4I0S4_9ALVE|eukprot:Cvel_9977.t1-p1 / transcript=Cvel_9977.t1 / gene=Cvel_9977 / organism=Chromera_velia_CCMP2878 / gene_product=hypothetical protein / transcript_product=hypothetical protein / location=Cvel_scaffold590:52793-54039(+) / protein_length=255 / sequence_SO=supercontig / SO=protein_coding / is_pseudo=false